MAEGHIVVPRRMGDCDRTEWKDIGGVGRSSWEPQLGLYTLASKVSLLTVSPGSSPVYCGKATKHTTLVGISSSRTNCCHIICDEPLLSRSPPHLCSVATA